MSNLGNFAVIAGILQLTVPSYALRLVRRFGAQRVGWFLVAAFVSLAALYFFKGSSPLGIAPGSVVTLNAIYAVVSLLLVIGMGHLETILTYQPPKPRQRGRLAGSEALSNQTRVAEAVAEGSGKKD